MITALVMNVLVGFGGLHAVTKLIEKMNRNIAGPSTLICYSDVLFNAGVVRNLLASEDEITVLVDPSFRTDERYKRKAIDLVVCDGEPIRSVRALQSLERHPVRLIGKELDRDNAPFEFIGLMMLSTTGRRTFMDFYDSCAKEEADRPFGESSSFAAASLTDFLQELILAGHPITAQVQQKGWVEIHDFESYRLAIEELSRP